MVFSSLTFLFCFLPAVLLLQALLPRPLRNFALLLASLFFYAWGEPWAVLVMLASIAVALLLTGIVITTIPAVLLATIVILNGTAGAYIAGNALLLDGEISHPGAVMSLASAFNGVGNALGPFVAGWALASTGSFEAAYRALGLFAPLAMFALWLSTRCRAQAPVVERA